MKRTALACSASLAQTGAMKQRLSLALLAALAACGGPGTPSRATRADQGAASGNEIACAVGGAAVFTPDCIIDRTMSPEGRILVIRHPDGGFRRLLVANDGRGVVTADGAAAAKVTVVGRDLVEVAVGADRYRLPATVKAPPPAGQ